MGVPTFVEPPKCFSAKINTVKRLWICSQDALDLVPIRISFLSFWQIFPHCAGFFQTPHKPKRGRRKAGSSLVGGIHICIVKALFSWKQFRVLCGVDWWGAPFDPWQGMEGLRRAAHIHSQSDVGVKKDTGRLVVQPKETRNRPCRDVGVEKKTERLVAQPKKQGTDLVCRQIKMA